MKCPKCGKNNVHMTNLGKFSAAVATATAASAAIYPFNRILARSTMKSVCENICPYKEYICLNPNCKEIFLEKNNF